MKVYTYVIVNDDGSAPNYDAPFVTLAVCKPDIRRTATPGNLVLAFSGKPLGPEPHAVRWAGVVAEKMTFAEYWADDRFQCKKPNQSSTPDNIYRPGRNGLVQVPNPTHGRADVQRDLRGEYVLVFEQTWWLGEGISLLPTSFGLHMSGRRKHRVHEISAETAKRLLRWLGKEATERNTQAGAAKSGKRCSPCGPKARC